MRWPLYLSLLIPALVFAKQPEPAAEKTPALNEIAGKVQSVDGDAGVLRILTEAGYNVEVAFNRATVLKGFETSKTVADLAYQDTIVIRYAGRDLVAREIEKPSLEPAVTASSHTPAAEPANPAAN
jgi:hypothetical protein